MVTRLLCNPVCNTEMLAISRHSTTFANAKQWYCACAGENKHAWSKNGERARVVLLLESHKETSISVLLTKIIILLAKCRLK